MGQWFSTINDANQANVLDLKKVLPDVATNLWNNKQSRKLMREQMQYQMLMQQQAQNWQVDMWNKANEYNDPSNQRSRLEKAGINPAMALGGVQGSSASSMSSPSAPSAPSGGGYMPLESPLDRMIQMKMLQSQLDASDAQTAKTAAEAELIKSQVPYARESAYRSFGELINDFEHRQRMRELEYSMKFRENRFDNFSFYDRLGQLREGYLNTRNQNTLLGLSMAEAAFNSNLAFKKLEKIDQYAAYDLKMALLQTQEAMARIADSSASVAVKRQQVLNLKQDALDSFWSTAVKTHGASLPNTPFYKTYKKNLFDEWQKTIDKIESETFSNYSDAASNWINNNIYGFPSGKGKGKGPSPNKFNRYGNRKYGNPFDLKYGLTPVKGKVIKM